MNLLTKFPPFLLRMLGIAPTQKDEDAASSELAPRYQLLIKYDSERHMHLLTHVHFQSRHHTSFLSASRVAHVDLVRGQMGNLLYPQIMLEWKLCGSTFAEALLHTTNENKPSYTIDI